MELENFTKGGIIMELKNITKDSIGIIIKGLITEKQKGAIKEFCEKTSIVGIIIPEDEFDFDINKISEEDAKYMYAELGKKLGVTENAEEIKKSIYVNG